MKVGITCDLRNDYRAAGFDEEQTAEFDREDTVEAIEESLRRMGFKTDRIGHIKELARRLVAGERWDLVFNIAEGLRGFGREAQVPALLDAYDVPYTFSDPLVLALTLHKAMTKRVIRDLGLPTPDFLVVEEEADLERVNLAFPVFAKPVAEGTSKGISAASKISTQGELASVCRALLKAHNQPVLVEAFLPGREFTVGIVGTGKNARAIGVAEVLLRGAAEPHAYSYRNKEKYEDLVDYRLVTDAVSEKAKEVALAAWAGLGCRDAGRVDLRADKNGTPSFMEVNPLAGLHPQRSDLCIIARYAGMTYGSLIHAIVSSALERCSSTISRSATNAPAAHPLPGLLVPIHCLGHE